MDASNSTALAYKNYLILSILLPLVLIK